MPRKLDFTPVAVPTHERAREDARRPKSREARRVTVQMSIRVGEDVYEDFRDMCRRERRTNGDMLETLMRERQAREAKGNTSAGS